MYSVREDFTPNSIPVSERLRIVQKSELGELIISGGYKGTYANEGCLILDGNIDDTIEFIQMVNESDIKKTISFINICITIQYEDQCNFELSSVQLQKLSSFNVPVGFTCYSSKG